MEELIRTLLENISERSNDKELNDLFSNFLINLQNFLDIKLSNQNINFIIKKDKQDIELKRQNILDVGVKRNLHEKTLIIQILNEFRKYYPIILLREAYYIFVPDILKQNEGIKIFINHFLELNFESFEYINEWKLFIRKYIVDYDILSAELYKIEKFLKLQYKAELESPIKLFFNYIRKNIQLIKDDSKSIQDNIIKEFILKTAKSINSDEMIETIRILINIFYKIKNYNALFDYQKYFKEFIKNRDIDTDLNLTKFSENVKWLNRFSYIGPSYQINCTKISSGIIFCRLRFNPLIEKKSIEFIIEKLPFFSNSKTLECNFAIEVTGWFLFPLIYLNDLKKFFLNLENFGFIINKTCILYDSIGNFLNLNYFREFYKKERIVNPNHKDYNNYYEIDFRIDFNEGEDIQKASIVDYTILNRVMSWSIEGFSFERRSQMIKNIKSDIFYEILNQQTLIKKLKRNIDLLQTKINLKKFFLDLLNKNINFGIFYVKEFLQNLFIILNTIKILLSKNPNISNINLLQEFINQNRISENIHVNCLLNQNELKKSFTNILLLYFEKKTKFYEEIKNIKLFLKILETFIRIKIFSLKSIKKIFEDPSIPDKIYTEKKEKLKNLILNCKSDTISSIEINKKIDFLINSNIIKPILINTINTTNFAKYFIEIIINDNSNTNNILKSLKKYFPRIINDSGEDIDSKKKLKLIQIYLPNINNKEKENLISIFYNLFKNDIYSVKRYFFDGFLKTNELIEFYDIYNQNFFYSPDLFKEFFIYVKKIFGNNFKSFKEIPLKNQNLLWNPKKQNFERLINKIDVRVSRKQIDFNIKNLNELLKLHKNLENFLTNQEFNLIKIQNYFKKYVKSIKFKPSFRNFGLGEYYFYIRPINFNHIDLKLLLINNFQKIYYPSYIDDLPFLFIKYFFPYQNPNLSYINWLCKSKKTISEYCFFFVKKLYLILQFDYNLSSTGWDLNSNQFKIYMQKILFNFQFREQTIKLKEYEFEKTFISDYIGKESIYFNMLTEIFSFKCLDLKSVMGTKNYSLIEKISSLLKKNLIFPYIKLKNLDFQEKICIILPSIKKDLIETIIKIFSFFNYCFIYEIEGEYFINGFPEEKKFENGLMIKLYLPSCELSDFQKVFDELFEYLKIKKYLILSDLVNGSNLLKSVFGSLPFLKNYNPLKNLIWNDKDKIWMNHKLFNEKFEPIYPNLFPKE